MKDYQATVTVSRLITRPRRHAIIINKVSIHLVNQLIGKLVICFFYQTSETDLKSLKLYDIQFTEI